MWQPGACIFKYKVVKHNKYFSGYCLTKTRILFPPQSVSLLHAMKYYRTFFQNNYDNFYSCFNIKKVKFPEINTLLDKKVVVRFISEDLNNIFFRDRIIINKNEDKYYFGNGNYKGEYTINNKDWIIIDFLPLKIWEKNNNFERKIIRPKLLLPYDIENNKNIEKKFSSGFIGEY